MTTATKLKLTAVLAAALLLATVATDVVHKALAATPPESAPFAPSPPAAEVVTSTPQSQPTLHPAPMNATLPSQSAELAKRSSDVLTLCALAQACNVYALGHHKLLPDHLTALLLGNYIAPRQLLSKRAATPVLLANLFPLNRAKSDVDAFAKQVDAHCDFVYLGAGLRDEDRSDLVLLYEKPNPKSIDGITVGFQDGHAEFVSYAGLAGALENTNAMLTAAGKPPVDIPTLLKSAPLPH